MIGRRSIVFYAWIGLTTQSAFLVGALVFILAGAISQGSAITANSEVERLELTNLALGGSFLDAQRALRGYQITGQNRFLQSYYTDRLQYVITLRQARGQVRGGELTSLAAEAHTAAAAFRLADGSVAAPKGTGRARTLFNRVAAESDLFVVQNRQAQQLLAAQKVSLAAASQRSLGVGLGASAAALIVGFMLPAFVATLLVRRSIRPLRATTRTVRKLAEGDHAARARPSGPAETCELAASINYLADESDRLRAVEEDRKKLRLVIRDAAVRIHEHLQTGAITRETVTDLTERLGCERVWIALLGDGELTLPEGNIVDAALEAMLVQARRPVYEYAKSIAELLRHRGSRSFDLRSAAEPSFPAEMRDVLLRIGGAYLLMVPFGAGAEPLGILGLLRGDRGGPWTPMEIAEIESLAGDIGQGLEHARMYQEEEQLVGKLEALDRAKTGFLASASHDVQTPLASIMGYIEMLQDGDLGPVSQPQARALAAVERGTRRLRGLIGDMLTMSTIELGSFRSDLRPVDLTLLIPMAVEASRPAVLDKGLALDVACAESGLMVSGDTDQLDRVLTNLLSNAVKYTPPGGSVRLAVTREDGEAVVSITDTGIGIPEEDQPSLFTPFFRASNAVESIIPGSGLGLSIVRTVIESHHGDVCLRSALGEGTTVTIRLPLLGHRRSADGTNQHGIFADVPQSGRGDSPRLGGEE